MLWPRNFAPKTLFTQVNTRHLTPVVGPMSQQTKLLTPAAGSQTTPLNLK